uniref:Uncharacterized protein n=1 Tax=Meloidogyne incognita TaxID=6306 RepID=A0A914KMB9_MELIC
MKKNVNFSKLKRGKHDKFNITVHTTFKHVWPTTVAWCKWHYWRPVGKDHALLTSSSDQSINKFTNQDRATSITQNNPVANLMSFIILMLATCFTPISL